MAVIEFRDNNNVWYKVPALRGEDGHSPYIKDNMWYTYNDTSKQYESTGVSANPSSYTLTKSAVE